MNSNECSHALKDERCVAPMLSFQIALRILLLFGVFWVFLTYQIFTFLSIDSAWPPGSGPSGEEGLPDAWCNLTTNATDANSAIERARSDACKHALRLLACRIEATNGRIHEQALPHSCPYTGVGKSARFVGCFADEPGTRRVLHGYSGRLPNNNLHSCRMICFRQGFALAGLEYGHECHCGNTLGNGKDQPKELAGDECDLPCPYPVEGGNCGGYWRVAVWTTGLHHVNYTALSQPIGQQQKKHKVRLLYVLMLNGRADRQVLRLLRIIYRPHHYYYIHVDRRKKFLHGQLTSKLSHYSNIAITRHRSATIWGGSSLLLAYLAAFQEILTDHVSWKWDYLINYSETDMPLQPVENLVDLLTANLGSNFLRSHHIVPDKFYRKQGYNFAFWECDNHLFRVGHRSLPWGMWYDGGSDWFVLTRELIHYVTFSTDELVSGLKDVFLYAILPAESFFHTVVRNSVFCDSFLDTNLKLTNWKRGLGCKCQHRAHVDWCGCSPKVFDMTDASRLSLDALKSRNLYTGRKFESAINLEIINWLEINNLNVSRSLISHSSWNKFWQNIFDPDFDTLQSLSLSVLHQSIVERGLSTLSRNLTKLRFGERGLIECFASLVLGKQFVLVEVDGSKSLLQRFVTNCTNFGGEYELIYRRKSTLVVDSNWIRNFEVGTGFDEKEHVFRDPLGVIEREAGVSFGWSAPQPPKATLVWSDPSGQPRAAHTLPTDRDGYIRVGETVSFDQGGPWSVRVQGAGHDGDGKPPHVYASTEFLVPHFFDDETELDYDPGLLVDRFFEFLDICKTTRAGGVSYGAVIKQCKETAWSSFSRDLKSEFSPVEPATL